MAKIRILIIDDHPLLRETLASMLNAWSRSEAIGAAGDAESGLAQIATLQPDLVLLDFCLPRTSGLNVIRRIRQCSPRTRILLLSILEDPEVITRALQEGAAGYCFKSLGGPEVRNAISAVMLGLPYVSTQPADATGMRSGECDFSEDEPRSPG